MDQLQRRFSLFLISQFEDKLWEDQKKYAKNLAEAVNKGDQENTDYYYEKTQDVRNLLAMIAKYDHNVLLKNWVKAIQEDGSDL